jgi:hypothetical protein
MSSKIMALNIKNIYIQEERTQNSPIKKYFIF